MPHLPPERERDLPASTPPTPTPRVHRDWRARSYEITASYYSRPPESIEQTQ